MAATSNASAAPYNDLAHCYHAQPKLLPTERPRASSPSYSDYALPQIPVAPRASSLRREERLLGSIVTVAEPLRPQSAPPAPTGMQVSGMHVALAAVVVLAGAVVTAFSVLG